MSRAKDANGLTVKQEAFVQAYLKTGNASEAYRQAYNAAKMKPEAIQVEACRLLASPNVALRLAKLQEKTAKKHEVVVDRLVEEYSKIAFADIRDMMSWDADGKITLKPSASLPAGFAATIAEVSKGRNGFKFKLHDKQTALNALGRHIGMFKDILEHTGKDGGPIETKDLSDMEAARRIAFMLGRAVGRGDRVAAEPEKHEEQAA